MGLDYNKLILRSLSLFQTQGLLIRSRILNVILGFEADKRAITITVNSLGTELSRNDRGSLFPELGSLYPDGHRDLVSCNDFVQVQATMEMYLSYEGLCTGLIQTNDKPLEKVWSCLSS